MSKNEIINAVLDRFAEKSNMPMQYVYGFMDALGALRDYLDNPRHGVDGASAR